MALKWYTIQAYSGYENKVRASLEERIKREGMEEKFGEICVAVLPFIAIILTVLLLVTFFPWFATALL